jgi:hypothetical protein
MARLNPLFVTLGWLLLGAAQDHSQQHVLSDDVAGAKPLPQAAEIVREKYVCACVHESKASRLTCNCRLKGAEIIPTGTPLQASST